MISISVFLEKGFRRATARLRSMPHFLIIGAQKAGTSSLFRYLVQHPSVLGSSIKEVHYFDDGLNSHVHTYRRGHNWYRSHFPITALLGDRICGEASPLYLFNPIAPVRIAATLPQARLIVLLREPAARAISHYKHERHKGREHLDLIEALESEEQRLAPSLSAQDYNSHEFICHSYKLRGRYAEQLRRYFAYFSPDRIFVQNSETMFREPASCLSEVCDFLNLDPPSTTIDLRPQNVSKREATVPDATWDYLKSYFRPYNEELFDLLGYRYDWWN